MEVLRLMLITLTRPKCAATLKDEHPSIQVAELYFLQIYFRILLTFAAVGEWVSLGGGVALKWVMIKKKSWETLL